MGTQAVTLCARYLTNGVGVAQSVWTHTRKEGRAAWGYKHKNSEWERIVREFVVFKCLLACRTSNPERVINTSLHTEAWVSDWTPVVLVLRSGLQVHPKHSRLVHEHPPFALPEAGKVTLRQIHFAAGTTMCWCYCLGQWGLVPPRTDGVWPPEAVVSSCRPWRGKPRGQEQRG